MLMIKRLSILLCVCLILMSIYHDLSKSFSPISYSKEKLDEQITEHYTVVPVKISSGDTLLSINEQLNPTFLNEVDMEQLLQDFMTLNPSVDPQHLLIDEIYYFPKYHL